MIKLLQLNIVFFSIYCFAQTNINFEKIDSIGQVFTKRLKEGNIAYFKKGNPPKDTWTYNRLLEYKKQLNRNSNSLFFKKIIEPSPINENLYAFNLCAYKKKDSNQYEYYFAAIVSIDTSNENYKIKQSYLFTENEGLKKWWSHIFGMYYENRLKEVPNKYYPKILPPPPFKE